MIEIRIEGKRLRLRHAQFGPVLAELEMALGEQTHAAVARISIALLDNVIEGLVQHPQTELALAKGEDVKVAALLPFVPALGSDFEDLSPLDRLAVVSLASSPTRALEASLLYLRSLIHLLQEHEDCDLVLAKDGTRKVSIALPFVLFAQ